MKVSYDPAVDALYISLRSAPIEETEEVTRDCNVDLDAEGRLVGIEILSASQHVDDLTAVTLTVAGPDTAD